VPVTGVLYYGARGESAFRGEAGETRQIATRAPQPGRLTGIGSRNHAASDGDARNARLGVTDYLPSGSSLKFCMLAEGAADVYPRYGPTCEWDTAAGQAILEAAGGRVMALDGDREVGRLAYGKVERRFLNPHFIAWGR
jgi:3'(2'), 5'-bisphosphate nucleotidase